MHFQVTEFHQKKHIFKRMAEPIDLPLTAEIPNREYVGHENQPQIEIPCTILPESKSPGSLVEWYFKDSKINSDINGIYKVNNTIII